MARTLSTPFRLLAIFTVLAFALTATVPFYCSTGWCCVKHSETEVADVPSCCAAENEAAVEQSGSCCGSEASVPNKDNSCDTGCPTGCCKIAAHAFVFSPVLAVASLYPVATLNLTNAPDTGIELGDHIPQPPRVLSA